MQLLPLRGMFVACMLPGLWERAGVMDERFAMKSKTVYEMRHEGSIVALQPGVSD